MLDENKIKEFQVELEALLIKYNVNLNVGYQIQVVPRNEAVERKPAEPIEKKEKK